MGVRFCRMSMETPLWREGCYPQWKHALGCAVYSRDRSSWTQRSWQNPTVLAAARPNEESFGFAWSHSQGQCGHNNTDIFNIKTTALCWEVLKYVDFVIDHPCTSYARWFIFSSDVPRTVEGTSGVYVHTFRIRPASIKRWYLPCFVYQWTFLITALLLYLRIHMIRTGFGGELAMHYISSRETQETSQGLALDFQRKWNRKKFDIDGNDPEIASWNQRHPGLSGSNSRLWRNKTGSLKP